MNFKFLFVLFIIYNNVAFGKRLKIIGGRPADIKDFPHSASIRLGRTNKHLCGGSIISNRHILTAAHCFDTYQPGELKVYTGNSRYKVESQYFYFIINCQVDARYTGDMERESLLRYDIAVATLHDSIIFDENQNKVRLPSNNPPVNSIGAISSWGSTIQSERQHPNRLQKAFFRILSNYDCGARVPYVVHSDQLCAFNSEGVGSCYGDSGAGLIYGDEIVGIMSFVRPCATGEPDVYTRVLSFLDFIQYAMTV